MTQTDFESSVAEMVERRVAHVRYHEIKYKDSDGKLLKEPQWNWCGDFDSLDHGLTLEMRDASSFCVTWGAGFVQYGIAVRREPLHKVDAVRTWDVTNGSRWESLVGKRITGVKVYWSRFALADGSRQTNYPQDLRLTFERKRAVYLSAFEVRRDNSRTAMADHITVFFSDESAGEYGIGPFDPSTEQTV